MKIITSDQNQWLKKIRLLKRKKERDKTGLFVIEGLMLCQEALEQQADIQAFLISNRVLNEPEVKKLRAQYSQRILIVEQNILEKQLSTVSPQGVAAIVRRPFFNRQRSYQGNLILIVDGVQDPGNLGTILRTALAAGVTGVFCLPGTVDPYNDKALRSTMGAIFKLPVFSVDNMNIFLEEMRQEEFQLVLADPLGDQLYHQFKYPCKTALILGSESRGAVNIKQVDFKVQIPLHPLSESLNVAVAGGILLYEINRQHTWRDS